MPVSLRRAILLSSILVALSVARAYGQGANDQTKAITVKRSLDSVTSVVTFDVDDFEDVGEVRHQFYVDFLKLIYAGYNLGYLQAIGNDFAIGASVRVAHKLIVDPDRLVSGAGAMIEGHYYFSSTPLRNFSLQLSLAYNKITERLDGQEVTNYYVTPGICVGYWVILGRHYSSGIEVGVDYQMKDTGDDVVPFIGMVSPLKGIVPMVRWTLGFSW